MAARRVTSGLYRLENDRPMIDGPLPAMEANRQRTAKAREQIFADPIGIGVKAGKSSRTSCSQAVGRKEYSEESGRAWRSHGRSSRFRRKLFHGPRYLAQTGRASRTALRETAIGHRDGPRGTNLRPKPPLLSHRELVSGPFCYSKYPEVDGSLLARAPEYRTHSRQAQRRYVQGVTTAF